MNILIIGAGGVASVLSHTLARGPSVSRVTCATSDLKRARQFLDLKNRKIRLVKADASSTDDIARVAKGADLIINASMPNFNEAIMKAALKAKCNYQDLCSHLKDLKNPEQLKYHQQFKKAGLVALINTGVAPGITNLLVKGIADRLDSLSDVRIRLLEDQKASEFIPSWSVEVTLDELSAPPLVYLNKRFALAKPFEDVEEYEFPPPYGRRASVNLYGDEVSTIPRYVKVKNVDFKSSGSDIDFSRSLYKLGFFSKKPVSINGKRVAPVEFFKHSNLKVPSPKEMMALMKKGVVENAIFISVVEGIGLESGRKIRMKSTIVYPDLKEIVKRFPGATYISYPTGISAAAFTKAMHMIKTTGVFPPEALEHDVRKEVLIELEANGIRVEEEFSKA
ncbi:saccharopine dehydrogenase NADP-binding domain-containing protein [Candidatus Woesearchaeota archaeon]|nr:saccharopine dehydrogenase NADP-binding domain-containing protein [Candidatus Woesearchaeota archaeon]